MTKTPVKLQQQAMGYWERIKTLFSIPNHAEKKKEGK